MKKWRLLGQKSHLHCTQTLQPLARPSRIYFSVKDSEHDCFQAASNCRLHFFFCLFVFFISFFVVGGDRCWSPASPSTLEYDQLASDGSPRLTICANGWIYFSPSPTRAVARARRTQTKRLPQQCSHCAAYANSGSTHTYTHRYQLNLNEAKMAQHEK